MGAFLTLIDPIAKIIDRVIPDKSAAAAAKAQLLQLQVQGQLNAEMQELQSAGGIITAEANSQSWLPRNVRPLLLLLWGLIITFNQLVPMIARLWIPTLQPLALDPWVYKLTAIGFTGYVTARTWEKVTSSSDN
jgi:hypothetical protein